VTDTVTYAIEAAVGVACLVAAAGIWRRSRLGIAVVLLGLAGVAAVVHAVVSLL
jgi:hypothetical protein